MGHPDESTASATRFLVLLLFLLPSLPLGAGELPPGVNVEVCQWYQGKKAAVTMRFDDAHPSHLATAAPMLDEYGLVGTFLVNPGKQRFIDTRGQWEDAVARGHELGNHTMNHRGARTDEEADDEIGGCSRVLWEIQPEGSRLRAFQRGGGTVWLQRKPMEFFLAKYDLFLPPRGSLSCSQDYEWFSVDRVRERLEQARSRREWLQTHFHAIDDGHLRISSEALRQLCQLFHADDLWSAGMSAVEKYRRERDGACVIAHADSNDRLTVRLACSTSPKLYDHPLTLEVSLPPAIAADTLTIQGPDGERIQTVVVESQHGKLVRFDVLPVESTFALETKGLGRSYHPQRGLDLNPPGPHPYVFFTKDEIPGLQEKATAPIASALYGHVKDSADRLVRAAPRDADGPVDSERARRHAVNAATLSLIYAFTGERQYAERAVPEIETAMEARTWVHPDHNGDADLVSAEITCGLALCYDWMYDALDAELRERMRRVMIQRGLEPIFTAVEDRVWWSKWSKCNWGSVICGQAGVAAMALLAEEPRAADWVRTCRQKIWLYTEAIGEDGGWGESASYCNYCWRNATMFMDALARQTGGRDDLFAHPRLRKLPDYFTHLLLPDDTDFVSFSNYNLRSNPVPFLWRLANEYDNRQAQRISTRKESWNSISNALGLFWCDLQLEPELPTNLPTCKHFRTIDWVILRSRWDDPQATLFAFKGGDNEWDHFHHDHNSFALWSRGRPLLTELGYQHKTWGVRTEAHNTIMVNEHEQLGEARVAGKRGDPRHRTEVGHFVDTPWYAHFTGDASMAYDPDDVESFVREVMYVRSEDGESPEYFLIFDDVKTTAPMRMDWIAHTFGELTIDGNVVTVIQDEAAADITVVAPPRIDHEVSSKSFEEAGVRRPFETAKADSFIKIRSEQDTGRARFLTVIAPRGAGDEAPLTIVPLNGPNRVGARILHGNTVDTAVFALDEPNAEAEGVKLAGRSCLVRQVNGRVTSFAVEKGQSLEVDGQPLFVSQADGQAVVSYSPTSAIMLLELNDTNDVSVHVPKRPVSCTSSGRSLEYDYDAEHKTMRAQLRGIRRVRVDLE